MSNNIDKYLNKVIQGDCLEEMKNIPDKCIDMILCDLPYGTTQNKWDSVIVSACINVFNNLGFISSY